jgi:hypothetical protein
MATKKSYRNATQADIRFINDERLRVRITPGDVADLDENDSWVKKLVEKGALVEVQNETAQETEEVSDVASSTEETAAAFEPLPPLEENPEQEKVSKPRRKQTQKAKSKPSKK